MYEDIGPQEVKNVAKPIQAMPFGLRIWFAGEDSGDTKPGEKPSIAVLPFDNMMAIQNRNILLMGSLRTLSPSYRALV